MFLSYNLFTFCWASIILILTFSSGLNSSNIQYADTDKLVHVFMFIPLTFLMIVGFKKQQTFKPLRLNSVAYSLVICSFYGVFIEIVQFFLPYRGIEFADIMADMIGVVLGYFAYFMVYKFSFKWA